jgi:hypothetical protein
MEGEVLEGSNRMYQQLEIITEDCVQTDQV